MTANVGNVAVATFPTPREQAAELKSRHGEACLECEGSGTSTIYHYITSDMASDAGEPEMAGQEYPEQVQCWHCGGHGYWVDDPFIAATIAALESEPT